MTKIFLATHANMAEGMKSTVEFLNGTSDNLYVYNAYVGNEGAAELEEKLDEFYEWAGDDNVRLLVSDILGGSVNHEFMQKVNDPKTYVLTGVNLPLLLELVINSDEDFTKDRILGIIDEAREGIQLVEMPDEGPDNDIF